MTNEEDLVERIAELKTIIKIELIDKFKLILRDEFKDFQEVKDLVTNLQNNHQTHAELINKLSLDFIGVEKELQRVKDSIFDVNVLLKDLTSLYNGMLDEITTAGNKYLQSYVKERANLAYIGAEFTDYIENLKDLNKSHEKFLDVYNNLMSVMGILTELSGGIRSNVDLFIKERDSLLGADRKQLLIAKDVSKTLENIASFVKIVSKKD